MSAFSILIKPNKTSTKPIFSFEPGSQELSISFTNCISDLSCAKNNFVSDDVKTACASGFS